MAKKMVPCATCGKMILSRDVHDRRRDIPSYCSRVCASNSKYSGTRYKESPKWERLSPQELLERKV